MSKRPIFSRAVREVRAILIRILFAVRRLVTTPTYKARLIFVSKTPGIFNWDKKSHSWKLPEGHDAGLYTRYASSLATETEFHIDVGGFETREAATKVGEELRAAFRLANSILGLGLHIPTINNEVAKTRLAPKLKAKLKSKYGAGAVDCVFGLNVMKEGEEFEFAVKGHLTVRRKSSDYILQLVSSLWGFSEQLDDQSQVACDLLNSASRDSSPRSAFLVTFLALDHLLKRRQKPQETQNLLNTLQKLVEDSELDFGDKARLTSQIGQWRQTSLKMELDNFVALGTNKRIVVEGESLAEFLAASSKLRDKVAHPPSNVSDEELRNRARGLRQVVIGIVWARNTLPSVSVFRPGHQVGVTDLKLAVF